MPAPSTRGRPKRWISAPAKKAGAYMPTRCHCMMLAPSPMPWLHATAASGAAVMMNIIETDPTTLLASAATNTGWRATRAAAARAGRPGSRLRRQALRRRDSRPTAARPTATPAGPPSNTRRRRLPARKGRDSRRPMRAGNRGDDAARHHHRDRAALGGGLDRVRRRQPVILGKGLEYADERGAGAERPEIGMKHGPYR